MRLLILNPTDVIPTELRNDKLIIVLRERPEQILTALLNRTITEESMIVPPVKLNEYMSIDKLIISTIEKARKEHKTFDEIAEILGISARTVFRYKNKLKIK